MKIIHPYTDLNQGQWLRGNLHAHTTASDGSRPAQEVIDDYAGRGYDFLMISDHDILTTARDHARWDNRGMLLIPGNEVTANGPHLLHVNASQFIEPDPDRQKVLGAIADDADSFAVMNHPNWQGRFDHCSMAQLADWQPYAGIEIYNGVIGRLDGSPYATNKWDMLLAVGRKVWGFANDDSHRDGEVELGWNMVLAQEKSIVAVVEALKAGRFYASTGVTIENMIVNENTITIKTQDAQRIVALQQIGKRFAVADRNEMTVEVPTDAQYVRFECWGAGEQFAWTQPFIVEN